MPRILLLLLPLVGCAANPASPPVTREPSNDGYLLSTNEPFRSVRIEGSRAHLTTPEIAGRAYRLTAPSGSPTTGLSWTGTANGARLALSIRPARCEDSMSGAVYPYAATISIDGSAADGCARRLSDPPPVPPS